MSHRLNHGKSSLVFVTYVAAQSGRGRGDKCPDHKRKRREDCEGSRGLAGGIGHLPRLGLRLFGARDRIIYAFLGVGLRDAGLCRHKLREVGAVGRRHVAVPNTVGEDAARLRGDILIAG